MLVLTAVPSIANDRLIWLDTRKDVKVPIYQMKRDDAKVTVVLLSGGDGFLGMKDGIPTSNNFLIRSREHFKARGFNVAIIGPPKESGQMQPLELPFRISPEHIEDLRISIAYLKKDSPLPVWVVGTSRGTVSAAAIAIAIGNEELSGVVLTSSITHTKKTGAPAWQKLSLIKIPVLVFHHEYDECRICVPKDASLIFERLENAPIKKEIYVKGGKDPSGDPCEAMHYHGFIGMEKEAVDIISDWINKPVL
jgi:hypothetical protein